MAPADAGIASGLVNTSRQVGGAIGLAMVTTVATTVTANGVSGGSSPAALTHGFRTSFAVPAGLAVVGAVLAGVMLTPPPRTVAQEPDADLADLPEAA